MYSLGGAYEEDAFRVATEIDFPPPRGKSLEIKTGCCHGMLCVSIEDDNSLVLWNPSIGICRGVCGLGFDPSMDDYKVVSFCEKHFFFFSEKERVEKSW